MRDNNSVDRFAPFEPLLRWVETEAADQPDDDPVWTIVKNARACLAEARCAEELGPDHDLMALAMHEWARLIRLAEDQQTLLDIADDIDANANALSSLAAREEPPT